MTPLPKRRHSHYRTGKRHAAIKLDLPTLTKCANPSCGELTYPHMACQICGWYDGKKVN